MALYEKTLVDVPEGRAYLEGRGITDVGLFGRHRIGYCNGRLPEMLPSDGPIRDELKALGVLLENGNERFTGCVVVPVFNEEGDLVTLYGRYTFANSAPSTSSGSSTKRHLFLPGRSTGIWNLAAAQTHTDLVLVESVLDALSLEMAGYHNVLAIQGTNGLKAADLATLESCGVRKLTLLLDGDEPGRNAAQQLKDKLSSSFSCEVRNLPDNHDPNSFLIEHGAPALAAFLAEESGALPPNPRSGNSSPENPSSFCASNSRDAAVEAQNDNEGSGETSRPSAGSGVRNPSGFAVTYGLRRYEVHGLEKGARKLKVTVRVEHAGKLHVDTLDLYSARARRSLCQDVSRIFEQPAETIEADVTKLMVACESFDPKTVQVAESATPADAMTAEEKKEAEAFGKQPDLFAAIINDYAKCGLVGENHNKLLCYLAAVSRKMDEPLSVLVLSSSGAGKTALQDATLAFCPGEDVVKLTSLSGKALFYKDATSLKHRILALEEGAGADEASYAIRNLISAHELVIESTIKDPATGRLTTMENRVQGPTAVFYTVTNPEIDPETRSRFFVLGIDESREQTGRILAFQRARHSTGGLQDLLQTDLIHAKHRNFQRLLRPLVVVNPYASQLSYGDHRLQARRDQPKYLNLIKAVAFLRQQRKVTHSYTRAGRSVEYITVDLDDIRLSNDLATAVLGTSLDELSLPSRNLLDLLAAMVSDKLAAQSGEGEEPPALSSLLFSRREIREHTGWSRTRVHIHLRELLDMEYVLLESGRQNCLQRYRLVYEGQGDTGQRFILGLKHVDEITEDDTGTSSDGAELIRGDQVVITH